MGTPSLFYFVNRTSTKRVFLILVIVGFGLRIGYGVIRYRSGLLHLSGQPFVDTWNQDALIHILIAKSLLAGKGYVVDNSAVPIGKDVPYAGQEALFKAPLYEFFLAGVFAVSGLSFKVLLPLQALLGGLLAGFVGLITWKVFRSLGAAWFAGMLAAAHPILVNSASQPYNENLFFFLYAASILFFLIWFQTQQLKWALLSGILAGMCTLTRENGMILIAAMAIAILIAAPRKPKVWVGCVALLFTAFAVMAPWAIRNYEHFGVFVPVSSITWVDFKEGNNECVAPESVFTPYWSEGPCPLADEQVRAQIESTVPKSRLPAAVLRDRASRRVAAKFVFAHPAMYTKLAFRRFWTAFLPYNPRGQQHFYERAVLVLYWILVFPAGISGTIIGFERLNTERVLLGLLILFQLAAITAVLYWSDLRFRLGIDLLLGCFAGWRYVVFFQLYSSTRRHPDVSFERVGHAP